VTQQHQHESPEECAEARRHQEFSLARLAACMGHMARHCRYNDGGTAGAPRVEIRRDGEALRTVRAGSIACGGRQTAYIFVYTAGQRHAEGARNVLNRWLPDQGSNLGPADSQSVRSLRDFIASSTAYGVRAPSPLQRSYTFVYASFPIRAARYAVSRGRSTPELDFRPLVRSERARQSRTPKSRE